MPRSMRSNRIQRFHVGGRSLLCMLLLLPILTACGSSDDEPTPEANDGSVETILPAASTRIAETQSMRFGLEIEGDTFIDRSKTIRLIAARGQLARPDSVAVDFQVSLFGAGTVSIRMVSIGPMAWTTDLLTGDWGIAPAEFGYNPTVLYDNQRGLGPIMGRIEQPELIGQEDVRGRTAHHISGTASQETIALVTSETMTGSRVKIELWIDKETSDLLRVRLTEPEDSGKENPAVWVLNLTDHGKRVSIEPPI